MLKPIPQENPDEIRKVTAKKAKRFIAAGPGGRTAGRAGTAAGPGAAGGSGEKSADNFFADGTDVFGNAACCGANHSGKKAYLCKIHQKMQAEAKKDHDILKGVCARLIQFIRKNGRSSKQEIMDLIYGLQRSVLSLERQRQRDFIKERRKKKK